MNFNLAEKLAIVKVIDEVVVADNKIDIGELAYLQQLKDLLGFNDAFIQESRQLGPRESIQILKAMSQTKKKAFALMLHEMAEADGNLDEEEMALILGVLALVNIELSEIKDVQSDLELSDVYFESSDHLRYENGKHVSGPHGGAKRAVKVEDNIDGSEGYTVTVYNLDGNHPLWGNNVQMAPKPMKIVNQENGFVELRGFGHDPRAFGHPDGDFSHYGITIYHEKDTIEKIVLHMHDRNVNIEYLR